MSNFTRRDFVGAVAAAAGVSMATAAAQEKSETARRVGSGPAVGPTNDVLEAQNLDSKLPPDSDAGAVETFKYPFSLAHKRLHEGGWSREVTVRELNIAKDLAGVNMRLTAGGIRELHWHKAAEWAIMLYGKARITGIDYEGKAFVADIAAGDLWYFPEGIPHSIQGLEPDGAEFLLVFDDGAFSEFGTVLLSDWMAHTPREVLAKNFGVKPEALANLPKKELFIFQSRAPGSLEDDQRAAAGNIGLSTTAFDFHAMAMKPTKVTKGGEVRVVDSRNFTVSKAIAAAIVTVHPGGLRELHWHPNADEWMFFIRGTARMTVFASASRARTMDFQAGDVGYVPKTLPHYVENTGDTDLEFIEMFKSSYFQDLSLNEWLTHEPPDLVTAHLNLDKTTIAAIPPENHANLPAT
jgi:oxalate decarboxylase